MLRLFGSDASLLFASFNSTGLDESIMHYSYLVSDKPTECVKIISSSSIFEVYF